MQGILQIMSMANHGKRYIKLRLKRNNFLKTKVFIYRCKWECKFDKEIKENICIQSFINELNLINPLEPRDAFFVERTEAFQLSKEATSDKQIKYYDVTSLYPFINKTEKIPVGYPERIFENFGPLKVLPPRILLQPVLPIKIGGKLMFPLCRLCAE